ncbi:MAG: hypothetical protein JSS40_01205 [Proteobacteria bacterium]|nr:hypothetical protein [Pseudomonadota bacterium]
MQATSRNPADALTLQLLEWIDERPHTYAEALDTWRTSCPRLSIWEDACIEGLIDCDAGGGKIVRVSAKGRAVLGSRGSAAPGGRSG